MGELHLEIIVDRLLREFKVEANVGKPQVAYKETIRGTADVDNKYARQSGGKGQYGHVKIRIEPNPGKGYEFVNAIVGGAIPALGWMLFLSPYHYINTGLVLESAMLGAPAGVFPYALICLIFSLILGALACVRYYFKDFNV